MSARFRGGPRPAWATLFAFLIPWLAAPTTAFPWTALPWLSLLGASAAARPQDESDTSLEEFDKLDPYTKADKAVMARLGYVSFGPFHWAGDQSSLDVQDALGGVPMIFIETAHFRLASTLETYRLIGDRPERESLEGEV